MTFEELADELARALDEAAEALRGALREQRRQQKYLANHMSASAPLVSRWLAGGRQLQDGNRLPGAEVMREVVKVLDLTGDRAGHLIALGERIDGLRGELEGVERWRARAGERYAATSGSGDGDGDDLADEGEGREEGRDSGLAGGDAEPVPPPAKSAHDVPPRPRTVPLARAVLAALVLAGGSFYAGTLVGGGGDVLGEGTERCGTWTDAGQGVQLLPCIKVSDETLMVRTQLRGPIGIKTDMAVQLYDPITELPVSQELKCHKMYITVAGQVQRCGYFAVRVMSGRDYAARSTWKPEGGPAFGGEVIGPAVRW